MADEALAALRQFEQLADERMAGMPLWRLPFRSIFSGALLAADSAFNGPRFQEDKQLQPEKGAAMLARYSYWMSYFRRSGADIGVSIDDALGVMGEPEAAQVRDALVYSHFCELMPFAHRGAYLVEQIPGGFRLSYPSEAAAHYEALDVVASELALTALEDRFQYDPRPLLRMAEDFPHIDPRDLHAVLHPAYEFHLGNIREDAFVGAEAYERVLGFRHDEFLRVRAAMMAFSSWCLGMATAAEVHSLRADDETRRHFQKECREWVAPLLEANFVLGAVQGLSRVASDRVDTIVSYFKDDPLAGQLVSGEGYLAPLQVLGNSLLVAPTAVQLMTPERNILYVLNRRNRDQFNDLVSAELEPSLLAHAVPLLSRIPGVEVKTNIHFKGREVDLVAYCRATNTALQVQAKAAIPANGARMTQQVETNCLTAVRQLVVFEALSDGERDELIATNFAGSIDGVQWSSGVLSRSSFGTVRAWEAINGRAALNLVLLKAVVRELEKLDLPDLTSVPRLASNALKTIADQAVRGWEENSLDLFGTQIAFPLLQLDHAALGKSRAALMR